uniref:RING-type domain-containing protein n=1 Tax=Lotharella oceanica TaxID=641309 RepID=A0A7S2TIP1_9EUKA
MSEQSRPVTVPIGAVAPPEEKEIKGNTASLIGADPDLARMQTMDYSCPICFELMENPVKTPCGHVFCLNCLQSMAKKDNFVCPSCRRDLKSFSPQESSVDKALSARYLDLNAKRVAAGLATPDSVLSVLDDLPVMSNHEAMQALMDHQRDEGLRLIPRLQVRKVRSSMVSRFYMQAFTEKRTTSWRDGASPSGETADKEAAEKNEAADKNLTTTSTPWEVPISPPNFFKPGSVGRSIKGTEEDHKEGEVVRRRHLGVTADFDILQIEKVVVEDPAIELPDGKLKQVDSGTTPTVQWHTLPPGPPKTTATKGFSNKYVKMAIENAIDEQNRRAKRQLKRILARRTGVRFYRVADVTCDYGRGRTRSPFVFHLLQTWEGSTTSNHLEGSGRPGKTIIWYKEYPQNPDCCTIL